MLLRMMAMAAGIALTCLFPQLPALPVIAAGLLLALCLWLLRRYLMACLMAGVCWGVVYGYQVVNSQLPADWQQSLLRVEGRVVGLPVTAISRGRSVTRFQLALSQPVCITAQDCNDDIKLLKLSWYEDHDIVPGQQWRLLVTLKRPYGMANPGGFNYQSWLIQQGVGGVGRVVTHPHNQLLGIQAWSLDRWRWRAALLLDRVAPDLLNSNLLKALLIGDKRGISRQQWDMFAATGTTHLMVISGLHIGLVSALVFTLLRFMVLLLMPAQAAERWAAFFAVGFALAYALAAGFTLPTQRALIMICVVMITLVYRRYIAPSQGVVVALLLCLMHDPLAPASLSFWLSFAAVICLFYGAVGRYPASGVVTKILSAQCLVFIGLLPVLGILLGQFSYWSPLANILLVPLFSLIIVPVNFIAALLVLVDCSSALLLWQGVDALLGWAMQYLALIATFAVDSTVYIGSRPWPVKVLALFGVALLLLPKGLPAKNCAVLMLLPLILYQSPKLARGDLRLTVLDVGQGLAIVINTRNYTLVYDLGPKFSEEFDTASAVVIPYLRYRGLNSVDILVLSHGDNDHIGGWQRFVGQIETRQLLYGEKPDAELINGQFCSAKRSWQWDQVNFEFLQSAAAETTVKSNNRSCVLKVSAGGISFLLPGDIETSMELALLRQYTTLLAANILIAPHHGSRSSSSWPFLKTVNPDAVIVSSGYRNQFGHPHSTVVNRYRALGIASYITGKTGALTFTVRNGEVLAPELFRDQHRRYWLQGSD